MKTIRIGIIGCGVIGPTHAESFLQQPAVEIKWACDTDNAIQKRVETELSEAHDTPGLAAGKDYYGSGHAGQAADFVDSIRESRPTFEAAGDVRHSVDVVLGIYESQKSGGWIDLP